MDNPRLFSLGEETTTHLARMLKVNTGLEVLSLAKHKIRDSGTPALDSCQIQL